MFGNIFLKTLRDHRWGITGWGLGLGLMVAVVILEYQQFFSNMQQQAEFEKAYQSFSFLIGESVSINTLGGFVTMETVVYGAVMLGLWAALVGVSITRGEEEPGVLDVLMSTPLGRMQIFLQKLAALAVAIVGATLLIGSMFFVGLLVSGQTLPFDGVIATLLNVGVAAAFWGAIGVLVGQLIARRRVASMLTGALIFGTYLFNSVAETVPGLAGLTWLSPFHYYNMSKPLVPGLGLDWWGIAALLGGTLVASALAGWLFARRDIGAAFSLVRARRPSVAHAEQLGKPGRPGKQMENLALLGSVFARNVRDLLLATLAWGIGLAIYCAMIVATTQDALAPMYQAMSSMPWFVKLFGPQASNEAYLSIGVFFYLPLMMVVFAITQVGGWASDEAEGRLEVVESEPVPRWQIALSRYGAATLSLAGILALIAVGLLGTAWLVGLPLDAMRAIGAILAMAPLALVTLAFGLAVAMWLPRPGAAVGMTGGLVIIMFFLNSLAPLFDWPDPVRYLSIFYLYGKPLVDGIVWANVGVLLLAALLLAAGSLAGFQRRDIAK
jgi:ABC-2 type transport system permease protein